MFSKRQLCQIWNKGEVSASDCSEEQEQLNLVPHDMPRELKEAIRAFIQYYNTTITGVTMEPWGCLTPYDVYTGRHLNVMQRRKEVKIRTLQARTHHKNTIREQGNGL
jgi:hypothetical protein